MNRYPLCSSSIDSSPDLDSVFCLAFSISLNGTQLKHVVLPYGIIKDLKICSVTINYMKLLQCFQIQPHQLLPFDSGISSYDAAASQIPVIMQTAMLNGDTAAPLVLPASQTQPTQLHVVPEGVVAPQPPAPVQLPPPILSPAPLPSGLFLTEGAAGGELRGVEDGNDNGGGGGGPPGDDDNLVTVAGVPLSVPETASVPAPMPPQLQPPPIVWTFDTGSVPCSSTLTATEVS